MVRPSAAAQQILRSDQRRKIPRSALTPVGNKAPNITFGNTSPNIRIGKTSSNLNTLSGNSLQVESEYFSLNTRSDNPLTKRSLSICSEDILPYNSSASIRSVDIPPTRRSLSIWSEDILTIPTHTISLRSSKSETTLENITANPSVLPAVFETLPLRVKSQAPQSKSFKDLASNGQREISANSLNRRSAFPNAESSSTSKDVSTETSLQSQKASKLFKPPATNNSLNKLEDCEQNSSASERSSPSSIQSFRYISPILVQTGKSHGEDKNICFFCFS